MKKILFLLTCLFGGLIQTAAQDLPTVSNDSVIKWYLIQFANGGSVITAETAGAEVTTSAPTGSDAQLWKVTGSKILGYIFTNKLGYVLNVPVASKEQKVQASDGADNQYRFTITKSSSYSGSFEIHPRGNSKVSLNLWGGVSGNQGVGLWDNGDLSNAVKFVDIEEFEKMGRISIIPQPIEMTVHDGELALSSLTAISYQGAEMKAHAETFAAQLATSSGITLEVKEAGAEPAKGEIWFGTDAEQPLDGYTLAITADGVQVKASGFGGWYYGLQTLIQLLPREYFASEKQEGAEWTVSYMDIEDYPHLGHRGYMLDIARHYFNKEEVKRVLDIMALYKMNRFHWHLTDDQGWRIDIPEYPKLTEIGSIRKGSFASLGDGQKFFDDTEYGRGMWYSLDDLREVVAYAKARNIEIIPEIDLPGHMVAAIAAYPEFSCDSTRQYEVRIDGGISHDVLNVGDDRVIDFLKCVLGHVAEVFPYKYVHIGGDECPTEQWAVNQMCLDRVNELGLDGVHQLQSWLVEELGIFLKENYQKDLVVWDELLKNWNDNNKTKPIIMAWNSHGHSAQAADRGLQCIIVPYQVLYLDMYQVPSNQRFVDEPYCGGWGNDWVNTLDKIYNFNPLGQLGGREHFALGVQGNMWTETCNNIDEVEYQLLPRMLALAEIGWLPNNAKDWASFLARMQSHDEIFDLLDYQYGKHFFTPTEYTKSEQTLMDAESVLEASIRGGVGYPEASYYDALEQALQSDDIEALKNALDAYKSAPIVQPQEGKTYQIVSASTFYRRQYEGSTMYQKNNGVRFHFTPQTEPEELWQFVSSGRGYVIKNLYSGKYMKLGAYNSAVEMVDNNGTPIRVDKATIATDNFTYIPGVVTLSSVSGYNAAVTGNVKRLSAEASGDVFAKDEAALCYNGTWRIVEVTDFAEQLKGLVYKCEIILITAKPGEMGNYTQEALDYLQDNLIDPASEDLETTSITESVYNDYLAHYNAFLQMPKASIAQTLREDCYYYIYNVWFGRYASYNASKNNLALMSSKSTNDAMLWRFKKNTDGTVFIYNKKNQEAAYISSNSTDQQVKVGKEYSWTLEERTLDGKTGICIIDGNGSNSWYTNPGTWDYVLMKPFWGACTWLLQESSIEVPTSITEISGDGDSADVFYDLSGRRVANPVSGIYIVNGEKRVVK